MTSYFLFPDFPAEGPTVRSGRKQYQVGETAHLTCEAQPSSPPTQLSWYINGEPASRVYLRNLSTTPTGKQRLGLSFPVSSHHFEADRNKVRLKCLASISNFYWKSVEITLLQEKPKFASVMKNGEDDGGSKSSAVAEMAGDSKRVENAGEFFYQSSLFLIVKSSKMEKTLFHIFVLYKIFATLSLTSLQSEMSFN